MKLEVNLEPLVESDAIIVEPLVATELHAQKVYTFMVMVTIKNSHLSGYTWKNGKPAHLDSYVKVKAATLLDAVTEVEKIYGNREKYWVKADESYVLMEFGQLLD